MNKYWNGSILSATVLLISTIGGSSFSLSQNAREQPPFLRGQVVNQITGEPVAIATVKLSKKGMQTPDAVALTNSAGQFQFANLPSADYSLRVERPEFMHGDYAKIITVCSECHPPEIKIKLTPLGVIAGSIVGDDGDPVPDQMIVALRVSGTREKPTLSQVARTTTDDLGSYRLHGLPPGRYYVRLGGRGHAADISDDPQESPSRAIYYPHADSQDQASAFDVAGGTVLTGINLAIPIDKALPRSNSNDLAANHAAVQGQVLNAVTGNPIPKSQVQLRMGDENSADAIATTFSDEGGYFSFGTLAAGHYHLSSVRSGFMPIVGQSLSPSASERDVSVGTGQAVEGVNLKLMPQGVIAGRIVEGSAPVSNAIVMAVRSSLIAGKRRLSLVRRTYSNDLGEYRLFALPPGHYYLSVAYHGGIAPGSAPLEQHSKGGDGTLGTKTASSVAPDSAGEGNYVTTLYPHALSVDDAIPLEVSPGSIQSSIDVGLFRMRKLRVSGSVSIPSGSSFDALTAVLLPRDSSRIVKFSQQSVTVDATTGRFELHSVPPGSYVLAVDAASGKDQYAASIALDVGKNDVEGLVVTLARSFQIRGRVTVEDASDTDLSGLRLELQSLDEPGTGRGANGSVNADGSFVIENLFSDHYTLRLFGLTGSCYLKSISLGPREVSSADVPISSGAAPLELRLSTEGGKVSGDLFDDQQHRVALATVVLIPDTPSRDRSDLYRTVSTDQEGRFSLQGIPPGDYKLFAWAVMDSDSYLNPDTLALVENLGQPITIHENSQVKVKLNTIAREDGG